MSLRVHRSRVCRSTNGHCRRALWKGGAFQWVRGPPGDSLQPEAIGAVMEVTKWLKPSISGHLVTARGCMTRREGTPVEGRGLSSRRTQQVARDRGLGNLATPKRVQKLQMALHAKAKAEAGYRFYALYDKLSREDILAHAYAQCRSNKGAPGIDGQDFADIEAYGVERWLAELALALTQRSTLHDIDMARQDDERAWRDFAGCDDPLACRIG